MSPHSASFSSENEEQQSTETKAVLLLHCHEDLLINTAALSYKASSASSPQQNVPARIWAHCGHTLQAKNIPISHPASHETMEDLEQYKCYRIIKFSSGDSNEVPIISLKWLRDWKHKTLTGINYKFKFSPCNIMSSKQSEKGKTTL